MQGGDREPALAFVLAVRSFCWPPSAREARASALSSCTRWPSLCRPGLYRTGGASSSVVAVLAGPWARFAALAGAGVSLALVSRWGRLYPLAAGSERWIWSFRSPSFVSASAPARTTGTSIDCERCGRFDVTAGGIGLRATARGGLWRRAGRSSTGSPAAYERGLFLALPPLRPFRDAADACAVGGVAALHLLGVFLLKSRGAIAPSSRPPGFAVRGFRVFSPRGRTIMIGALLACALVPAGVLGARFARSRIRTVRPRGHLEGHQRDDRRAALLGFGPNVSARFDAVQLPGR